MSALITTLFALAISAQTPALRPVTLGERIITPKLPTWTALETPATSGDAYFIASERGNHVVSMKGTTWAELTADAGVSDEGAMVWPTQIFIIDRTDHFALRGLWRQRRGDFFTDDLRAIEQETALFVNMVRIATKGKVRIAPTWTLDEDVQFGGDDDLVGPEMLRSLLTPLLPNGHRSVLVVHPAFLDREVLGEVDGTPFASIAFYRHADAARPGQVARAMFNAWAATLPYHLREAGWMVPDSLYWPLPAPAWGAPAPIADLSLVPGEFFAPSAGKGFADRLPPLRAEPQPWETVRDDPWSQLPRWKADPMPNLPPGAVPGIIQLVNTSLVPPTLAEWMAKHSPGRASGTVELAGRTYVVFQDRHRDLEVAPGRSNLDPQIRDAQSLSFSPGQGEKLPVSGWFEVKTVGDPDRGSVAEIRELSVRRSGWVRMLGAVDAAKTPFLEFWLKPRATVWPLDVWLDTGDGQGVTFRMFGGTPAELDLGRVPNSLKLREEPAWQRVVIEIGKATTRPIRAIYLRVPPSALLDQMPRTAPPALLMDDFEVRETASASVTEIAPPAKAITPAADSTLPEDRARFIAMASRDQAAVIAKLLEDPSDFVKQNALAFFVQSKQVPPAIEPLVPLASHFNSRTAKMASELLAQSGSSVATDGLRRAIQFGIGDFTKGMAANSMPRVEDRKILGEMTLLLNVKSPAGRAAAVRGLSRQSFPEADLILMSFLNDTDPRVRYEVVRTLRLEQDSVLSRLQTVAQMDLSESVRALANARLLGTKIGARVWPVAAKDPSRWVRILTLRQAPPSAAQRSLALAAATEEDPLVAVAGIEAMMASAKTDPPAGLDVKSRDPRVWAAWFRLAIEANLSVPADAVLQAESSRFEELAALARKLKGRS